MDIDHFKQVNDTYGHSVGDVVLQKPAAMRSVLRDYETIGRYGGEEFLIVLSKADMAVGQQVGERISGAVGAESIVHGNTTVDVKVSVGLASTEAGFDPTALVNAADGALYRAKQQGRNRVAE